MHYDAFVRREGKHVLADFPDCPGCQTFADTGDALAEAAQEALEGWLEAHLVGRQVPPRPSGHTRAPSGAKLARVPVRAGLAAALAVRWARHDAGLNQTELGKLAGVTQQQIAKLEDPDENPSLATLEKIARALGRGVDVTLELFTRISIPPESQHAAGSR
jgi:DNA-binding XRE family transcriptional regulator/predicted RNase H-like HicB family nuclease